MTPQKTGLSYGMFKYSATERYPTRTAEHLLAWFLLAWSAPIVLFDSMLTAAPFKYLIVIAPEWWWGWSGVCLGLARIAALLINGSWRRSPGLRFIGAMTGMIWWIIISGCYWAAVQGGSPDFPIRYAVFVLVAFEAYSCFRCGQDHASPPARDAARNG